VDTRTVQPDNSLLRDRRGPVGDSTMCERWEVGHGCISNQITQAINSTASGPYGTCQLHAFVAYLTITWINTRKSTRFEGLHLYAEYGA
jgi:hypothetical protein